MNAETLTVENHIGLVHACAKRFRDRGIEYEDVVQCGCIGLLKAIKSFDVDRGVQFSTYAVPVILGEIKQTFRRGGAIKVSRRLKDLSLKIGRERESFVSSHGREPSVTELSELLGVDSQQIVNALDSSAAPVSLTLSDDESSRDLDIPVEFDEDKISSRISLLEALRSLDEKDAGIIDLRFFKNKTQAETAKILGMTQVKVSRREKALLKILREKLS